jgi:uncharacterized protein
MTDVDPLPYSVSRETVRAVLLAAQGIEGPLQPPPTKEGVLEAIRLMGQLQIDTIHVVSRSPYFVLWSRLGDYDPDWLDELLAEGAIYEAWSHEACFMPREQFPSTRARIHSPSSWRKRALAFLEEHRHDADRLLEHIHANGPVRSADFARPSGESGGWWEWKHEKYLLEALFAKGSLMVARRERFQRLYDLPERVVPDWDDAHQHTHEEMVRAHVLDSVRALGVAARGWIPDYYRLKVGEVSRVLPGLVDEGALLTTEIDGICGPAYVHPDRLDLVRSALAGDLQPARTVLLSPFDPVVWDRKRDEDLYDFFYRIECYTPEEKRQYGYFSLPILHRGALAGRLDAKAHRKDGVFEVRSLHLEPGVAPEDEDLACALAGALQACARWHKTPKVVIRKSAPRGFAKLVRAHLVSRPPKRSSLVREN